MLEASSSSEMLPAKSKKAFLPLVDKGELEEVVGDFGATLSRKHKHRVPGHIQSKVTARWRDVAGLLNLLHHQTDFLSYLFGSLNLTVYSIQE